MKLDFIIIYRVNCVIGRSNSGEAARRDIEISKI